MYANYLTTLSFFLENTGMLMNKSTSNLKYDFFIFHIVFIIFYSYYLKPHYSSILEFIVLSNYFLLLKVSLLNISSKRLL